MRPEVTRAPAEDSLRDAATGFAEGDLRGWFRVEVPASRGRQRPARAIVRVRRPVVYSADISHLFTTCLP